ncbi:MAG TPA: winged helix DNA-binding protein [Microvirga sp.]|jgi:DNA-binding MarR family transcriptional regulator|nr:winged helix DNA-binding protein [Microvirga sp.]
MATGYLGIIALAERLHRRAMDIVEAELVRLGVGDLNATQAMILLQIGAEQMSVGELTLRGCYQGSNVHYSLSKLVEGGYVLQERSARDRRVVKVSATDKGRRLAADLEHLYAAVEADVIDLGMDPALMERCEAGLTRLERLTGICLAQGARRNQPAASANVIPIRTDMQVA